MGSDFLDLSPAKDGGILKEIIREGTSSQQPTTGCVVTVHYVGTLTDGTKFDSSRDRGEKFEFNIGKGEVIKAWDFGVASMKIGEICKLTSKSNYAYGKKGSPPTIPPDATLIFEIELFDFKNEDLTSAKDGGITRKVIQKGNDSKNPNNDAIVEIHLVGKMDDSVFDDRKVKFNLGESSSLNIPDGLEMALMKFNKDEKSSIFLTPKYGFGADGNKTLNVPPNASLEYEIHLENFENTKEVWEMDQVEKLEKAKVFKTRGAEYFSESNYKLALKQYTNIPDLLSYDSGLTDEQKVESAIVLKAAHLNLSLCYSKLNDFLNSRDSASKALDIEKDNVKGLFRRAKAKMMLQEIEDAKRDLERCVQLDPHNKAVTAELRTCLNKIKEQKKKDETTYKGMFDKFAKRDARKPRHGVNSDVMSGDMGEWQTQELNKEIRDEEDDEEAEDFSRIDDILMI